MNHFRSAKTNKIKTIADYVRHKFAVAFAAPRIYRNWPVCFLDYFGMLNGRRFAYRLRQGAVFMVTGGTGALQIINEIWMLRQYFRKGFLLVGDNYEIIDIGANIGVFSIYAASSAKNVKVFSYEPVEKNFDNLTENVAINGYSGQIKAFREAVAARRGRKKIYLSRNGDGNHSFLRKNLPESRKVSCVTLSDIIENNGIDRCDLLKLDVEGAEYEILLAAPAEVFGKISSICLEFHDALTAPEHCHEELIRLFEGHGFIVEKNERYNIIYATKIK
jgi:FkbM family methyltransferase